MSTYFERHLFRPVCLAERPQEHLRMAVVIPCFNEKEILKTLGSLHQCRPCSGPLEVIVVINSPAGSPDEVLICNEQTHQNIEVWRSQVSPFFRLFVLRAEELPAKHAGVGLARKIGMDEAAWRFHVSGNKDGIIVCLDADCTVSENYLIEIEKYFTGNPDRKAASVYFEHPLNLDDAFLLKGVVSYELHLRYYVNALRYAGYPYSYHTIGSCMCVTSGVYMKAGGMNRRKAGEDFYFLHKIIPLGGFGEINSAAVYPSPRVSERVPFGTGRSMSQWIKKEQSEFTTYHFSIFEELKIFMDAVPRFYDNAQPQHVFASLPRAVKDFLLADGFFDKLKEIRENTGSREAFIKRFFNSLDGFKILKLVHSMRDGFYPPQPVGVAAAMLLDKMNYGIRPHTEKEMLLAYRSLDRSR